MGCEAGEYDPPSDAGIKFDVDGEAARKRRIYAYPSRSTGGPKYVLFSGGGLFLTTSSGAFSLRQQPNKLLSRRTTARRERAAREASSATPPTRRRRRPPALSGPWVGHLSSVQTFERAGTYGSSTALPLVTSTSEGACARRTVRQVILFTLHTAIIASSCSALLGLQMNNRLCICSLQVDITALVPFFQCLSHLRLIIGVRLEYYDEAAGKNF